MVVAFPAWAAAPPVFPLLDHPPLSPPLRLTGSFGEHRGGHFHAGLDLSTNERVGAPVFAPAAGRIVRVRASGAGYGRAIYLETRDGRLLVLAHLDAFDEPLASWIAAVQDSSGQYEQDLWPDSSLFHVTAGQRLGWSGRSGTGPPHLHFEIRRGDIAINPLLAGAEVEDLTKPVIRAVTLEPLDGQSSVAGGSAPYTVRFPETPDSSGTVEVRVSARGRLRLTIEALDARTNGRLSMAPWSAAVQWEDERVECRFDSVSWAEGMSEVDFVYDRGRATDRGTTSVLMWAPRGFRPRVLQTDLPRELEAGTIEVRDGTPKMVRLSARDAAGAMTNRYLMIVPGAAAAGAPDEELREMFDDGTHVFPEKTLEPIDPETSDFSPALPSATMLTSSDLHFASLPDGWLRLEIVGRWAQRSPRAFSLAGLHPLRESGGRHAAVFRPSLPHEETLRIVGGSPRWRAATRMLRLSEAREGARDSLPGFRWWIPERALFEPAIWAATTALHRPRNPELAPASPMFDLAPDDHPLRAAIGVALDVPARHSLARLGLYRDTGSGWDFVSARIDTARRQVIGETRRLGRFSLFRDQRAPRIEKRPVAKRPKPPAAHAWALEARLAEQGSGIDARATRFEVDGRAVPSEWDAEERTLRWRPLRAPAAGKHRYQVVAVDRAGNTARVSGSFVLD